MGCTGECSASIIPGERRIYANELVGPYIWAGIWVTYSNQRHGELFAPMDPDTSTACPEETGNVSGTFETSFFKKQVPVDRARILK